ncbi:hypothetical protein BSLG_000433 [Batrachochytrium salamandrivorans]|nr:hypothetical protein BASA62_001740 [Batrachochytrium salamandrivorans]KAJ1344918.1 hypothetical protein BSLG_000433 [Batrachochytrium salamandrivorans]
MEELAITAQLVAAVAPNKVSGRRTVSQNLELFGTVHRLLDQLKTLQTGSYNWAAVCDQTDSRTTLDSRDEAVAVDAFTEWLAENKIAMDGICIKRPPGNKDVGLGVFATHQIKKGDSLAKVPLRMIITNDTSSSPALDKVAKTDVLFRSDPSVSLVVRLLQEYLEPTSFWQPYFGILPRKFTLPVLGSVTELTEYSETSIIDEVVHDLIALVRQYLYLQHMFKAMADPFIKLKDFTFVTFSWARAIVSTRQNEICYTNDQTDSLNRFLGLIPLFDMFNHAPCEPSTTFDAKEHYSETTAACQVDPGEQIFINYGNRSNQELFIYSGFVDPSNTKYDRIRVLVSLAQSDPVFAKREKLLEMFNMSSEARLDLAGPPVIEKSAKLIRYLQVLTMDAAQLEFILNSTDPVACMLSSDLNNSPSKIKALEWIRLRCLILKRGLEKHVATDQVALEAEKAGTPAKLRLAEYAHLTGIEIDISSLLQE